MHLSPKDLDKLILHQAGFVAQKRYARGLKLNYPETVALLASQLMEFIRDGESVVDLMNKGKNILGLEEVLPGVPEMVTEVQIEATFPDGTKLVTVHQPLCRPYGKEDWALYGSGLVRRLLSFPRVFKPEISNPGIYQLKEGSLTLNTALPILDLLVINKGDRPIQVGSHYPFFESNTALVFDRKAALGYRLNIPAGTAVRFEPGEEKKVNLVPFSGEKKIFGGNAFVMGSWEEKREEALQRWKSDPFRKEDTCL